MGINSAGHRLDILKAIYRLKVDNAIPIEPDHYVPLCEVISTLFHLVLNLIVQRRPMRMSSLKTHRSANSCA